MKLQRLVLAVPLTACALDPIDRETSVETSAVLAPPVSGQMLGSSMATGDFDGDGFEDLAVGAPGPSWGSSVMGRVYLYKGSIFGLQPWRVIEEAELNTNAAVGDQFGFALVAADFDRDGNDDLAIGSPGSRAPNGTRHGGVVFVMFGRSDGLVDSSRLALDQSSSTNGTSEAGDRFGAAIAAGDLDGDGFPDLAVGAPGEATGADKTTTGYVNTFVMRNRSFVNNHGIAVPEADRWDNLNFGGALAIADFDHDGFGDLVVTTNNQYGPAIKAYVYRGEQFNFAPAIDLFPGRNVGLYTGSLAIGNFDGATYAGTSRKKPELVVAEPWSSAIQIFRPDVHSTGLVMTPLQTIDTSTLPTDDLNGVDCGVSMVARDLDGDGLDDLVVGCPSAATSGLPFDEAGGIAHFRGRSTGLVLKQMIHWTFTASDGQLRTVSANDKLGASVAVGDFFGGIPLTQIVGGMPGRANVSTDDGAVAVFSKQSDNTFQITDYVDQYSD